MTIKELKAQLESHNVNIPVGCLKADLEKLLDEAIAALDAENEALDGEGTEESEETSEGASEAPEEKEEEKEEEVIITDPLVDALVETAIKEENASSLKWDQTADIILKHEGDFQGDLDKKGRQKLFTKFMDDGVNQKLIPETGLNRQGEEFELRKRGNKIKWSSWVATARIFQNTSDIWKGVELLGWDIVFPEGVIIGRYELLELIKEEEADSKVPEPAEDTIARCLDMVTKKIDDLSPDAVDSIDQRLMELNMKYNDWKAALVS